MPPPTTTTDSPIFVTLLFRRSLHPVPVAKELSDVCSFKLSFPPTTPSCGAKTRKWRRERKSMRTMLCSARAADRPCRCCLRVRRWRRSIPTVPVKIVVPFPAGGTADAVPRLVGDLAVAQMGAAGRHREQDGRGRQYRRRDGLQRAAGRLHLAVGAATAAGHQSQSLSEARLRSDQVRADHRDGACAERVDRQSEADQGIERAGVDRLSQGKSRQGAWSRRKATAPRRI